MDKNKATEIAYKNGYTKGIRDGVDTFLNTIYWKAVKHIKGKYKDECFVEISFKALDESANQVCEDLEGGK